MDRSVTYCIHIARLTDQYQGCLLRHAESASVATEASTGPHNTRSSTKQRGKNLGVEAVGSVLGTDSVVVKQLLLSHISREGGR